MFAQFPLTTAALSAALLVYFYATVKVGRARMRFGVQAPQVHGHPDFERIFRAHQNTLEQMVPFVPLALLMAELFSDTWAGIYGAVWVVGRILYIEGYARAASKRMLGFAMSGMTSMVAAIACAAAIAVRMLG